jgi:mannan endo-1,4-beta-mannosidase
MLSCCSNKFVQVKGTNFFIENKEYIFLGTNFWYGMNLASSMESGDRARLLRELDQLHLLGVKNLRIMAGSEGPNDMPYRIVPALQVSPGKYDTAVLDGLDFLLAEMKKREMKAIMCLNNFWHWSGGMSQYLVWAGINENIPYPPPHPGGSWSKYQRFTAKFYSNEKAKELFQNHIRFIVNHRNSYTKLAYKDDTTIMAWEIANEPRGDNNVKDFRLWVHQTAKFIKSLDKNHLVTTGSEGNTPYVTAGTDLFADHTSEYIDYATFHIWVQNWNIFDPLNPQLTMDKAVEFSLKYIQRHDEIAMQLGKPLVLEEFGMSRDFDNHDPNSKTTYRDQFYSYIFSEVLDRAKTTASSIKGVNFWAWAGEGRPTNIHGLWQRGNDFIGDPPHEYQGWYSVYNTDLTTNAIIALFTKKFDEF